MIELIRIGFLIVTIDSQNAVRFEVSSSGNNYYSLLKKSVKKSVDRVEREIRNYIDDEGFQQEYSKSYEKWQEAESLLLDPKVENQLSQIGLKCIESMIRFAKTLKFKFELKGEKLEKNFKNI